MSVDPAFDDKICYRWAPLVEPQDDLTAPDTRGASAATRGLGAARRAGQRHRDAQSRSGGLVRHHLPYLGVVVLGLPVPRMAFRA
jgi:hypothetical protein